MRAAQKLLVIGVQALLAMSVLGCLSLPAEAQEGRDGPRGVVLIHDIYELQNMSLDLNGSYALANDINAYDSYKMNGNNGFQPVGNGSNSHYNSSQHKTVYPNSFHGDFDGKGFSITHLYGGLFGVTSETASITNLTLGLEQIRQASAGVAGTNYGTISRCNVSGTVDRVSGLVGWNYGTISDCQSATKIQGNWNTSGGLVGENKGIISNCSFNGSLNNSNPSGAGGIASFNQGTINNCFNSGNIECGRYTGGIVGMNSGTINYCFNIGKVNGKIMVGGVVGANFGKINRCFNNGSVQGLNLTGGVIGWNVGWDNGISVGFGSIDECANIAPVNGNESTGGFAGGNIGVINNSYNLGVVIGGNSTGGFMGAYAQVPYQSGSGMGLITNCYSACKIKGEDDTAGFIGKRDPDAGNLSGCYFEQTNHYLNGEGVSKTKDDMMRNATFVGWDFENIWKIAENLSYPSLRFVDVSAQRTNHNPMITTHPYFTTILIGQLHQVQYQASDPEGGEILAWSLKTNASWLSMTSSGLLSGTPGDSDVGYYSVGITVSDGRGGTDSQTCSLRVKLIQRTPVWSIVPTDTNLTEGDDYNFTVVAVDPDEGDILTYAVGAYPMCGLSINQTSGDMTWLNVTAGYYQFNLTVSDEMRSGTNLYFNLTVAARPTPANRPPKIVSVSVPNNTNVSSSKVLTFSVDAIDADGDNLTFDWQENGVTLSRDSSFSHKFPPGDHSLILFIGDGKNVTAASFNFTVIPPPKTLEVGTPFPAGLVLGLVATTVVILISVGLVVAGTETGKYSLMVLFLPLYTRIHKEKVLDSETRGLIRGCIISDPGIHYKEIARRCNLGNGSAVHHLHTLEREGIIRSQNDGRYRRFYPAEMKLAEAPLRLSRLQKVIFEVLREKEGLSQLEIASLLEASYPTIHRHINRMADMGVLRLERHGMTVRCYIANGQTQDSAASPAAEQDTG
jgi:predicted transcriptional regulator